jgi:flagellar L-ring protein precursor FlgH
MTPRAWTLAAAALVFGLGVGVTAQARMQAPPPRAEWPSLVADRAAAKVGDALTVLIYQDSKASNSTQQGSHKNTRLTGTAQAGTGALRQAQAGLAGDYDGSGLSSRADQVVASISVVVTAVLANGDLQVAGQQAMLMNGGRTLIRVSGRVRPSDIAQDNTVMSTRIADASIAYDGAGFGQKPGLFARVLDRLGVF